MGTFEWLIYLFLVYSLYIEWINVLLVYVIYVNFRNNKTPGLWLTDVNNDLPSVELKLKKWHIIINYWYREN